MQAALLAVSVGLASAAGSSTVTFDVVALAVHPTCVTKRSLEALQLHFDVRDVHIITGAPGQCHQFSTASTVQCHSEDQLLAGVTLQTVQAHLKQRLRDVESSRTADERAGWYFQQLLKLGSAEALPSLSQHYMIWDLDMIPLRSFPVLLKATQPRAPMRTRVDVSAIQIKEYGASYQTIFHKAVQYPQPGMSYVAHWMMVYKPYMQQMLANITHPGSRHPWAWALLDSVQSGHRNVYYGLSEYTMYISWVLDHYPESMEVVPKKDWMRVAPRRHQWLTKQNYTSCCPHDDIVDEAKRMGWAYLGWELGGGHAPECETHLIAA